MVGQCVARAERRCSMHSHPAWDRFQPSCFFFFRQTVGVSSPVLVNLVMLCIAVEYVTGFIRLFLPPCARVKTMENSQGTPQVLVNAVVGQ